MNMPRSLIVILVVFLCCFLSYVSYRSIGLNDSLGTHTDFVISTEDHQGATLRGRNAEQAILKKDSADRTKMSYNQKRHIVYDGSILNGNVSSFYGHVSFVDSKHLSPDLLNVSATSAIAKSSQQMNDSKSALTEKSVYQESSHPGGPLSLNLAFVHMRKAGGTHLLSVLNQVIRQHNCTDSTEIVGTSGVQAGIPLDMLKKRNYTNVKVKCPNVNMIHIEMSCMRGDDIIQLPRRDEMRNKHFSLFTTLRDPIERIGSQANYGKHSVGFIVMNDYLQMYCSQFYKRVVDNFVYENILCGANPGWPQCHCYKEALSKAKDNIATNESVWLKWIHGAIGFDDRYMPNYYTKRLVGSFSEFKKKINKKTANSIDCFKQGQCFTENGYMTMVNILKVNDLCPLYYEKNETEVALKMAKTLLANHYDFILQERFNDTASLAAFRQALHISFMPTSGLMGIVDNRGITTGSRDTDHRRLVSSSISSHISAPLPW